jgi:hypothetical protein
MPRLAANLSMMFNEHAFLDRFEAAAKAGFEAVEFLFPYEYDAKELRSGWTAAGSSRRCSTCRRGLGGRRAGHGVVQGVGGISRGRP